MSFSIVSCKLGCVVRMVVDSMLFHATKGPNDHRKDAPPFKTHEECPPLDCNELNDNKNRKIMVKSFWKMEMVAIVQMKLQSRLGYLIMKN